MNLLRIILGVALLGSPQASGAESLAVLMPREGDHTEMWWADGFPSHTPDARWLRWVRTGSYAFALHTETLRIPHFGAAPAAAGNLESLPPADLALTITVAGKTYRATAGGPWSKHAGPRLIESGRFLQRADVTDLAFTADDGAQLNVEARFEAAAWPDRLGLILAARPGLLPIPAGESCFGRVGGGFGLDGMNHLEIPLGAELDPEQFTLEFWAYIPSDYQASEVMPWLVCKNAHEQADGNFGIVMRNGAEPQARLNIGGGRENAVTVEPESKLELKKESWHHLAISYDGNALRLFADGRLAGEKQIGKKRVPVPGKLAFGRRQDNSGDGYRFRGAIDEVRLHDRALTLEELRLHFVKPEIDRPALKPVAEWTFRADGDASSTRPSEQWGEASIEVALGDLRSRWELPDGETWSSPDWNEAALAIDPVTIKMADPGAGILVRASEIASGAERPVTHEPSLGWHRVNLDEIEPTAPPGGENPSNDAIERVKLVLTNSTDREQVARLMFEKTARGFRQRIGTPITGVSAILRDREGNPTGIPVQLSKNWHNDSDAGVYAGQWFHGISQVRLPAAAEVELELTLAYGHWGGVPAASHAQLSLIGWGGNQLWDQSAIGSFGESICYDPDQIQANCTITDVRPLMVRSMGEGKPWGWTSNAGGGDFFRFFDSAGQRVPHGSMHTAYHRQGPCLTEVAYSGRIGTGLTHATTVSLARGDDVVRGVYRIRLDVTEATDFSRFVIFQIGADTYSSSSDRKMAVGDETGLLREWETQWGGDAYRTEPVECASRIPWASLHETVARDHAKSGAVANRGLVIRSWNARLGGKAASPWMAERGLDLHSVKSSTLDILPPPGVTRLEPGDFVEATIEHIVAPRFAKDYYGPNEALLVALTENENTWRMIFREAIGNDRKVEMTAGSLERLHPDIRIKVEKDAARFKVSGGLGHVPITFTGLSSSRRHALLVDGVPVDQSVHGNDFWQTDYDSASQTWSQTFNVRFEPNRTHEVQFSLQP